jgi:hypothetical protein
VDPRYRQRLRHSRREAGRQPLRLAVIGLGLAGWLGWTLGALPVAAQGLPWLVISPAFVDLGTIRKSDGKAEARYTLRNEGRAPLRILRIVPT